MLHFETIKRVTRAQWIGLLVISCTGHLVVAQTNTFPSSGNAGVGTVSPDRKLTVVTATSLDGARLSDGTRWLLLMPGTVGGSSYNSMVAPNDNAVVFSGGTQGSGGFVITPWSSAIGGLRMDNLGNIGIGIRNPITSGTNYNASRRYVTISGLSEAGVLQLTSSAADAASVTQGLIEWTDQQSTSLDKRIGYLAIRKDGSTANNRGSAMTFATRPDNGSVAIERMRISAEGRVGIGNTDPDAALAFGDVTGEKIHLYTSGSSQYGMAVYSSELRLFAGAGGNAATTFGLQDGSGTFTERMRITGGGNVGIGTQTPDARLAVNGTVHAKEVIVDTSSSAWSDYVFAPDYRLVPLSEVERQIKTKGHLPGIPSAAEVAEHGVSVGEMQAKLLAKIEELTLHQIEQEKRIEHLERENRELRSSQNRQ